MRDENRPDWSQSVVSGTPKPSWDTVPADVRLEVEDVLGAPVVSWETQPGGFTPSVSVRVRLADGGAAFVKAADGAAFPQVAAMHRKEAAIVAPLADLPEVPRLLGTSERGGWVALAFEDVAGRHPRLPWDDDDLDRVLDALDTLSRKLTPNPVPPAEPIQRAMDDAFGGWRSLRADPHGAARCGEWAAANLDRLARIETGWTEAAAGATLLHGDLRADQFLLTDDGLIVVDWPHACVGADWIDPLFMFPSVRVQGGPDLDDLLARCRATTAAPRRDVVTMAVALAGYFTSRSGLPDPPGLPTVRDFQRAQGEVLVEWLAATLDGGGA